MVAPRAPGSAVTARDEVLGRIRAALGGGGAAPPSPPGPPSPVGAAPGYRTHGPADPGLLLDLMAERLADYRATVRRAGPGDVLAAVIAALAGRGAQRMVRPPGLDLPGWPATVELVTDDGQLSARDLDAFDGVITTAAAAIAETGTIILDGSAGQGRRALSLIPDYHLCLVRADQVVALVPEAVERLHPDRPLTWISGPSATSDIELERVEGVHGPRTLEVILIGPPGPATS
jgi:L-lactate dehydrogenase complex protein LldG